jgi:hypothetical protein
VTIHSVLECERRIYTEAYARPCGMRAGFEYFRAFEKDAQDFGRFAQTPLPMPMIVLIGEKASVDFLIQQGCPVGRMLKAWSPQFPTLADGRGTQPSQS